VSATRASETGQGLQVEDLVKHFPLRGRLPWSPPRAYVRAVDHVSFAVLDRSRMIRAPHLWAALAFWEYAKDSARRILGDRLGDHVAEVILDALRAQGPLALTGLHAVFGRHRSAAEALSRLEATGRARRSLKGGRPSSRRHPQRQHHEADAGPTAFQRIGELAHATLHVRIDAPVAVGRQLDDATGESNRVEVGEQRTRARHVPSFDAAEADRG
jgi:hypothetical protein